MVLYSYFDGGNQSDSRQYDYVSLAAVFGTFLQWNQFTEEWRDNLKECCAEYLHTTDAAVGNEPYSRNKGWDRDRIDEFVCRCVRVAQKHLARPVTDRDYFGRVGLVPYVVTLNLKDYVRARNEAVGVPNSADEVLATEAINACFKYGERADMEYYCLVFDRNEPFRGHIEDRRTNPRVVKALPMFDQILSSTEAISRCVPALQLADLLAYCFSHKRDTGAKRIWEEQVISLPVDDAYGDYPKLINPNLMTAELRKRWRIPNKAKTK